ncbi:Membrane associated serine protease, rhomboid family [Sphingomonas guangdongensis]|uniref:Membrane associated serine protease, rhomboid family n=1 Tax=Sphingomonas guangdongensis TaxID=1141890 RepID=A0A285R196_9SPHN|nr:rhomboid family intramembrane serine protease [Sphingomonas guangdongensis]SOB87871.1 Membrane associated serine protease, rhomboid family [Sphingomonas guangdongensis]
MAPATLALAVLTALVSAAISIGGLEDQAAVAGGFMPLRATLLAAGDGAGLVSWLLTPLTATLIHGGVMHLAFNLITLIFCGMAVERVTGSGGALVLYLVGAYAACAAQWAAGPHSSVPMIGASGAASALVGAYALLYGRARTRDIGPVPGWLLHVLWLLAAWTVLNLAIGLLSVQAGMPIAAAAHIGGFLAGLLLCRPLLLWRWRRA